MSIICERFVSVRFSTRNGFSNNKQLKSIGELASARYGSDQDVVVGFQRKLPKESLDEISMHRERARRLVYEKTMQGLIPAEKSLDLFQELEKVREDYEKAVDTFVSNYAYWIEEARRKNGVLFDEADYPPVEAVKAGFKMEYFFTPLDKNSSFGATLDAFFTSQVEASNRALAEEMAEEMAKEMAEVFGTAVKQLEGGQRLFDSIKDNIEKTLQKIDGFCKGIPKWDKVRAEYSGVLDSIDIGSARVSRDAREKSLAAAKAGQKLSGDMVDRLSAIFGGK